jgi:hypothetical protein
MLVAVGGRAYALFSVCDLFACEDKEMRRERNVMQIV